MQTEARVLNSAHGGLVAEGGGAAAAHKLVAQKQQQRALHHQSQIGTISQLVAGGVAGAVSKTCTAPLARLTILFQIQGMHSDVASMRKACIWREASRIISEEGFRAFWKGNLVTIAHRLPYSSISFYAFEHYKNSLQLTLGVQSPGQNISADLCIRLVGGGLAGITAASATYPLDLVRTRLAAQTNVIYYRGIGHALCTISREEGAFGLYKGLGATLLGVGPNLAISFSVYDTVRSYWQTERPNDSTILVSLACGSLSGVASSTGIAFCSYGGNNYASKYVLQPNKFESFPLFECNLYRLSIRCAPDKPPVTFPLDLVRRRMQLEGAGGRARVYNTGLFGTFGHIIRAEGLKGLYRGILPEYYKVVPSIGIVFMTYEKMKQILSDMPAK